MRAGSTSSSQHFGYDVQIVEDEGVDASVRVAAALNFKNVVKSSWVRVLPLQAASSCQQTVEIDVCRAAPVPLSHPLCLLSAACQHCIDVRP